MARGAFIRQVRRILIFLPGILVVQTAIAQQQDLDFFLTQGLLNSPLLKDYQGRISSALIDSTRLRAANGLQVNASSSNSYAPVIHGWGFDEVKTDIGQVSGIVGISKEINGKSHLHNRYEAIALQNQRTRLDEALSERDLRKEITSQYIEAYGLQLQHTFNREILAVLRQEEQLVKKLVESGSCKQTEYLSIRVNLSQQELLTTRSSDNFRSACEALNYLCGLVDTSQVILTEPSISLKESAILNRTIFYRQFEIDSLKLINATRQINFNYRPRLTMYADGGYLSSMIYSPWKNFGMSAGFTIAVPIYDGHQKKMQRDQLAIEETTRRNYLEYYSKQYRQQIAMLTRQMSSNKELSGRTRDQLNMARTLVDANRVLLEKGDISVTDYLLSVNSYLAARSMFILATVDQYNLMNEFNYWNEK